jgi:hypothetical protein
MTKIGKKAAQDFFCAVSKVFDRVKTVALWSAKNKIKRTIKGYGSAVNVKGESLYRHSLLLNPIHLVVYLLGPHWQR